MANSRGSGRFCVFCRGQPVTAEHVWPDWVGQLLKNHFGAATFELAIERAEWEATTVNLTIQRVCGRCNHGWLSQLESRTKPILSPLILGTEEVVVLSPLDQMHLATWGFRLALVFELTTTRTLSPDRVFRQFRSRTQPPRPATCVLIGAYGDTSHLATMGVLSLSVTGGVRDPDIEVSDSPNLKIATFTIGRALLQVIHYIGDPPILLPPNRRWTETGLLAQIWPPTGRPVSWPPNGYALNDYAYDLLAERRDLF